MCGIVGFLNDNPSIEFSIVAANECIAHRGPDARGTWSQNNIVLGHLRLSIIDLSDAANQPMHSHCGRYVMVYNGEIYNYREIQQEIFRIDPGFQPRTHSDSEIILEAFARWGNAFVSKLNGMFAIAIWDKLDETLSLFRDRLGIKPLYYFQSGSSFGFSSELKALSLDPSLRKHLSEDAAAINQFLHLGYIPAPYTIFREIRKLPAGHWGVFSRGDFSVQAYWRAEEKVVPNQEKINDQQALSQLKQLLESSVQYRLIADVPYGTFLSGGIDSSLVTAVAQSLHNSAINTFSVGFWDKDYDESGYASQIAEYLGTNHHAMRITEQDALAYMPLLTGIYDEPFADSSAIPTLLVSQMARKHVTMTLSGDGGDELFLGYGAYKWAQWLSSPSVPLIRGLAAAILKRGPVKYRRAAGLFESVAAQQLKSHIFSQEQYLFSRRQANAVLNRDMIQEYDLHENFPSLLKRLSPAEQQALFDLTYYLPDDLLVKVDRASMFFALETRVPLLDYRIVEFALNLPRQYKFRNGQTKWLLQQLLASYIPKELFQRPKRGFAVPLQKWLRNPLKEFAMDYLHHDAVARYGVFDPLEVNRLVHAFYHNGQDYLYNRVWQLVVMQKWLSENRNSARV
ncbi:MAG: asparagine synthase (glutamine-hydrolyzing) [Bacteroidota bacterium]